MPEIAVRVGINASHEHDDRNTHHFDTQVAALAIPGEEFEIEKLGGKDRILVLGGVATVISLEKHFHGLSEKPNIKEVRPVGLGIHYGDKIVPGGEASEGIGRLVALKEGQITITFTGRQVVATALRELEYRSGNSPSGLQATYIRRAIGLALSELGPKAVEAMRELFIEFLSQDRAEPTMGADTIEPNHARYKI